MNAPDQFDAIIEMFNQMPIPHGEVFDDNRRWCSGCERPQLTCAPGTGVTWTEKSCRLCTALWPEYTGELMYNIETDEDFIKDNFPEMVIN